MTSDPMQDPRRRMRNILSEGELEKTAEHNPSPLSRLPRARPSGTPTPPRGASSSTTSSCSGASCAASASTQGPVA